MKRKGILKSLLISLAVLIVAGIVAGVIVFKWYWYHWWSPLTLEADNKRSGTSGSACRMSSTTRSWACPTATFSCQS